MRITITIFKHLAKQLKRIAMQAKTSVSAVIGEALRAQLGKRETSSRPRPFRLITVKG